MEKLSLGEKIMIERKRKGFTVYQLADMAGVSRVTLISIERGDNLNPNESTLRCIAEALGTTVKALKGE
jgi:HTH-type transcriptional regulator, biofilm formation regulator